MKNYFTIFVLFILIGVILVPVSKAQNLYQTGALNGFISPKEVSTYSVTSVPLSKIQSIQQKNIPLLFPEKISRVEELKKISYLNLESGGQPILDKSVKPQNLGIQDSFQGYGPTNWIPPDGALAAGNSQILEAINASFAIYSKTGTLLYSTTLQNWFSSLNVSSYITDPRAFYDSYNNRFVMLASAIDFTQRTCDYVIAISQTSSAIGSWWIYKLDATKNGSDTTSNWADYPAIGFDSLNVYITSNQFSFSDTTFQYVKLRMINKSTLYNGNSVTWTDWWNLTYANNSIVSSLQPARGGKGTEYFVSNSWDQGNNVTLWSISNYPPVLSRIATINVGSYSMPPDAVQLGGSNLLRTGDCRIQDVIFKHGLLHIGFTQAYNWGSGNVAALRLLKINPVTNTVPQNIIYGQDGVNYFYPAVECDTAGNMFVVYNTSSSANYCDIRSSYEVLINPASTQIKSGEGYYSGSRWGDYNSASVDPTGSKVWIEAEYPITSNYGTWIASVTTQVSGGDQYEPNNDALHATQLAIADSINATVDPQNDVDYYKFTATLGQNIEIHTINLTGSSLDGAIWLYDSTGTLLSHNDDFNVTSESKIIYQATRTGTLYIRYAYYNNVGIFPNSTNSNNSIMPAAKETSPSSTTGGYALTLKLLGQQLGDRFEPNNDVTHATPITFNDSLNASIFPAADIDYYKFNASSGQTFQILINDSSGVNLGGKLKLYDNSGNILTIAYFGYYGGLANIIYVAPSTGTYYIRISYYADGGIFPNNSQNLVNSELAYRKKSDNLSTLSVDSTGNYAFSLRLASLPAPSNLIAGTGFEHLVPLNWNFHSTSNFIPYRIYRSNSANGTFSLIESSWNYYSYVDTTANNNSTYYYKISTYLNGVESSFSNIVSSTPSLGGVKINSAKVNNIPTIDGNISTNEWNDATPVDITNYLGVFSTSLPIYKPKMYIKNDLNYLYIAIDDSNIVSNTYLQRYGEIGIYFDANNNGKWPANYPSTEGNFWIYDTTGNGTAKVLFRGISGDYPYNLHFDYPLIDFPNGVKAAISWTSGHFQVEVKIDLTQSNLKVLSGKKFSMFVYSLGTPSFNQYGFYPDGCVWNNPLTFAKVSLNNPFLKLVKLSFDQIDANKFPTINNYVSVLDTSRNSINNLADTNFVAYEDGILQKGLTVTPLGSHPIPISVGLVIDRSGSMGGQPLTDAKNAASLFVDSLKQNDRAAIISFDNQVYINQTFTSDKTVLKNAISNITANGATAIYDAAFSALDLTSLELQRKTIILLTDGGDNSSTHTLQETINKANQLNIPIHTIGLGLSQGSQDEKNLIALAQGTGGRYYYAPSSSQLLQLYKLISQQLQNQYLLSYITSNKSRDGKLRKVTILVSYNSNTDTASRTYLAPSMSSPKIVKIFDVPNDNGKNVFIRWRASLNDGDANNPVAKYSIWRQDSTWWTYAGEVPARSDSMYAAIVPTIYDSTKLKGMFWSMFEITAHGVSPTAFATSNPDSGYSLDNLIPSMPDSLKVTIKNGVIALQWSKPVDKDFQYFAIYRDTSSNITLSNSKPFAFRTSSTFLDSSAEKGKVYYYRIAAVDFSGNISKLSITVNAVLTNLDEDNVLPISFSLSQNYPNPFNPSTVIQYDLPKESFVTLKVYDILGREVKTLVNEDKPAGRYKVNFDAAGLSSGIYFYRIIAGGFIETKKFVLMR